MAANPQEVAARWSQRLAGSTDKITSGVQSVTVSPGQAAARQKTAYVAQVQANADKWARNVGSVSLNDWQTAMTTKGVQRIAGGAQAAEGKFANFMTQLLPFIDNAKSGLGPRGTLDQNIARMDAFARKMSTFKRS